MIMYKKYVNLQTACGNFTIYSIGPVAVKDEFNLIYYFNLI